MTDRPAGPARRRADRNVVERMAGALTGRVVDGVVDHVDLDAALAGVDVNAVLERVDVDALLDRIDVDRLMDRVDVDRLLSRVDVEALVARSGVPDLVTASTTRVATSTLDLARRQVAGVDFVLGGVADRLLRRPARASAGGPAGLVGGRQSVSARRQVTGYYAGPVGRLLAVALDALLLSATFSVGLAALDLVDRTLLGRRLALDEAGWWGAGAAALVAVLYSLICLTVAGRTVGKAVVGLRVVTREGAPIRPRAALLRTLALPFSALFAGLGFVPVLLGREHRALHDVLAGTAVVLDFGDRPAELPGPLTRFLDRSSAARTADPPER